MPFHPGEELYRPAFERPLRHEARQFREGARKVDPIAARIVAELSGNLDTTARQHLPDDLRDLAHRVVRVRPAYVENPMPEASGRRLDSAERGTRDVFDMNQGPPGRAVGH